jgi:glycosyltransferase involved in cell wall biosynthesis
MSRSPKVAYWNNIPAPYMVDRFDAVARRGALDFEVWFSELETPERSWRVDRQSWVFAHRLARVRRVGGLLVGFPPRIPAGEWPDLVVSLYAEQPYLLGLLQSRLRGGRSALWVEVTFDSWVRRSPAKECLKRRVFAAADGILTVGQDGRAYARKYGAEDARIHYLPHVIDAWRFASESAARERGLDRLRAELGLRGVTFVYVGRLWSGKGVADLIAAFAIAQRSSERELSLLLVGDGPDEAVLRSRCAADGLQGVVFAGFRQQDELAAFYAASDVFVFPTLGDPYGLVVDEAMACSLPVLSSTAAGEIGRRVTEGVTGYLFNPGDVTTLAEHMVHLAGDRALRRAMGIGAAYRVSWQSPEAWAIQFERVVLEIVDG